MTTIKPTPPCGKECKRRSRRIRHACAEWKEYERARNAYYDDALARKNPWREIYTPSRIKDRAKAHRRQRNG